MRQYLARRALLFIPTLFLASLAIFGAMRVLPGDVALAILGAEEGGDDDALEQVEALREELGLTDPLPVQYVRWAWSMVNGEFGGKSLADKESLRTIIALRLPVTFQLASYAILITIIFSVPLGILAAIHQDKWPDYLVRVMTIAGHAVPNFWIALLLILSISIYLNWSPPVIYENLWENPSEHLQLVIWPTLILAWGFSSNVARVTRSNMLEVLRQDYIRTARSKGLQEKGVIWRHALKNALIPVVTVSGLQLAAVLGGTVILETIYGMPGLGQGVVEAAFRRDYPVIQSLVMVLVFIVLSLNLLTDLLYAFIDPRISYS